MAQDQRWKPTTAWPLVGRLGLPTARWRDLARFGLDSRFHCITILKMGHSLSSKIITDRPNGGGQRNVNGAAGGYTAKRMFRTSPSFTTYSLPSTRSLPADFAESHDPSFTSSSYATTSARMKPRS